jgi:hypothetical protein
MYFGEQTHEVGDPREKKDISPKWVETWKGHFRINHKVGVGSKEKFEPINENPYFSITNRLIQWNHLVIPQIFTWNRKFIENFNLVGY